jgi:peptidyl-prolyl cis-trans isomerase A (cyclophilin A)
MFVVSVSPSSSVRVAVAMLAVSLGLAAVGCEKKNESAPTDKATTAAPAPSAAPTATVSAPAADGTKATTRSGDDPIFFPAKATLTAPEKYKVKFETTQGDFVIEVTRAWAPKGADRFFNLVKLGFFDGCKFFRAIEGFMVQFGINGDPSVSGAWFRATMPDDPVKESNKKGFISFATSGKDSRTTQVFINYGNNERLDGMGFAPFGKVVEGANVVDALYKGYGEGAPGGNGPEQGRIQREGNAYLEKSFPKLDGIKRAQVL